MSANQPIGRILLKDVRLAFPSLFEPTTVNGEGKPRYSATFILPAERRVCVFDNDDADTIIRPGPRLGEGARLLADCLRKHVQP